MAMTDPGASNGWGWQGGDGGDDSDDGYLRIGGEPNFPRNVPSVW